MRDVKPSVLSDIFHYAQLPEEQLNAENEEFISNCKSNTYNDLALSEALL